MNPIAWVGQRRARAQIRICLTTVPAALAALGTIFGAAAQAECGRPERLKFEIVQTISRSKLGLTQGLEFHSGKLYESTGRIDGTTQLNSIDLSGTVTTMVELGNKVFGEGLTILNGEIFQLTWQEHQVFAYDLTGKLKRTMRNPHPGWGLANDGRRLLFTDGGPALRFADPRTFAESESVAIRWGEKEVRGVNELEHVDGKLYGNIFLTRQIVRFDPQSGCVEASADLAALWSAMDDAERQRVKANPQYVLNGIAYDPQSGLFYLTGKRWRYIFVGRFSPAQ